MTRLTHALSTPTVPPSPQGAANTMSPRVVTNGSASPRRQEPRPSSSRASIWNRKNWRRRPPAYFTNLIMEKESPEFLRHSLCTISVSPWTCWMLPQRSQTASLHTLQCPSLRVPIVPQCGQNLTVGSVTCTPPGDDATFVALHVPFVASRARRHVPVVLSDVSANGFRHRL